MDEGWQHWMSPRPSRHSQLLSKGKCLISLFLPCRWTECPISLFLLLRCTRTAFNACLFYLVYTVCQLVLMVCLLIGVPLFKPVNLAVKIYLVYLLTSVYVTWHRWATEIGFFEVMAKCVVVIMSSGSDDCRLQRRNRSLAISLK